MRLVGTGVGTLRKIFNKNLLGVTYSFSPRDYTIRSGELRSRPLGLSKDSTSLDVMRAIRRPFAKGPDDDFRNGGVIRTHLGLWGGQDGHGRGGGERDGGYRPSL